MLDRDPDGGHRPSFKHLVSFSATLGGFAGGSPGLADYTRTYIFRSDLYWVGSALDDLRDFPDDARREAGHQLHLVQLGLEPDDWKPMPSVGTGVYEIRIRTAVEHRVFYIAKFTEGVYVLHAFEKRTQRTRQADLELGQHRLRDVLAERRARAARAKRKER